MSTVDPPVEANATKTNQPCKAVRKDGSPCRAPALRAGLCFAHDPGRAEERTEARRRGGQNRAAVVRLHGLVPPRLMDVYAILETALGEVHSGSLAPGQAQAMAALARAMVAVLEAGEVEERVRALEAKAGGPD